MRKHFSSIVVSIIILLEIAFTAVTMWLSANEIEVPSTLIMYWHITFMAELFACASIKVAKVVKTQDEIDEEEGDGEEIVE